MTTGTLESDLRYPVATSRGSQLAGYHYRKTWSGDDGKDHDCNRYEVTIDSFIYRVTSSRRVHNCGTPYQSIDSPTTEVESAVDFLDRWSSNDDIELVAKLAALVRGNGFMPLVSLAEANKTFELITVRALHLKSMFVKARRNFFGRALKSKRKRRELSASSFSQYWLELQYGWKPLLYDIFEAINAFDALVQREPPGQRYTAKMKVGGVVSRSGAVVSGSGFHAERLSVFILTDITSYQTVSLVDPLTTVNELTPYSFIADWFIPISSWLEALGFLRAFPHLYGCQTKYVRFQGQIESIPLDCDSWFPVLYTGPGTWRKHVYVLRRSTSLSVPLPKPKGFEGMNLKRTIDAVALLIGTVKNTNQSFFRL